MDKKRKKVLIFFGVILFIGLILMLFLFFKKPPVEESHEGSANVISKEPTNHTEKPSEPKGEDKNDEEEEKSLVGFASKEDENKLFMDGNREKAEIKQKDYTYLLSSKPIDFKVQLPPEWENQKTQVDEIPGFYEKAPSERAVYYQEKTDFTEEQKKEIEKIKELNSKMYEAYQKRDYNTFLMNMYKGWREYYGVYIGKIIKSGDYKEKNLGFYPEKIDTKIGYAYGFMVREISYIYQGEIRERRVVDCFVVYKQNDAGDWEVYYEHQL
ncbi:MULTISPECIES: hypothetical protein [Bacillus cereus group]|uniref:Uncharacterized protein n=1 Tax=Bacillus thuringiensis TaxID=1428 RepID=A0A9X6ZPK7_BACTU|nr:MULTISPECIES: hypothetical protein [Bacillus cereus group]PFJ25961.1 hypothetical protein COJ15_35145 [Bacillus thuringiensis]PGP11547.1 hypothetical protein COA01_35380 [Bacillus cereus]